MIITYDSPEAASIQTVSGWVSRNGRFFGNNEDMARYDGCTHRQCGKCGILIPVNGYCKECASKARQTRYKAMPRAKWNGTDLLYSDAYDEWFRDSTDMEYYCAEIGCTIDNLDLIIGVPVYAREIDEYDYYSEYIPEDGDLPMDIQQAFIKLNETIRKSRSILSWKPGKFAAGISL